MQLARACADRQGPLVVVHGGGDAVTRLGARLGLEARFENGRRVTSPEEMEIVEMVLGGVNPALVRALAACGRRAVGVSGSDAGLLYCQPLPGLGRAGRPVEVDPGILDLLLAGGYTPVVSPAGVGPDGEALNVNADEAAAAIAAALGAERLLLVSDVDGVRVGDAWQKEVAVTDIDTLVASGEVTRGMIPKLEAAAVAVRGGVREVRIAGFAGQALDAVVGTRVTSAAKVGR
jgi:acetylglutamate kinase